MRIMATDSCRVRCEPDPQTLRFGAENRELAARMGDQVIQGAILFRHPAKAQNTRNGVAAVQQPERLEQESV